MTIPGTAAMTGQAAKAVRRNIESGVWQTAIFTVPDGDVLTSVKR